MHKPPSSVARQTKGMIANDIFLSREKLPSYDLRHHPCFFGKRELAIICVGIELRTCFIRTTRPAIESNLFDQAADFASKWLMRGVQYLDLLMPLYKNEPRYFIGSDANLIPNTADAALPETPLPTTIWLLW